jgi:rhamnose utilization protein RhaD (predicted bifunctional aldolase and dehydrogenase)
VSERAVLAAVSQAAGGDVLLVQGGGGNASVKAARNGRMWIKASGYRLAQVQPGFGCLAVDLPELLAIVRDAELRRLPADEAHDESVRRIQTTVLDGAQARPSLETAFHAVLGPVVLHTHPVYVNAFTCLAGGQSLLAEALGSAPVWVPYTTPGFALGVAVDVAVQRYSHRHRGGRPYAIFLENHGLIASGQTASAVLALTADMTTVGERVFGALPDRACDQAAPPSRLARWAAGLEAALARRESPGGSPPAGGRLSVRPARYAGLTFAEPAELAGGPLVPDDVVYCGERVWLAQPGEGPGAWLERCPGVYAKRGFVVVVPGLGPVLAGPGPGLLDALEENLLANVLVRYLAARRGPVRALPPAAVAGLARMESEAYRQSVASAR